MNETPKKWIKQIESLILQSQEIPMWGTFPSFPWKDFAKQLSETLQTKGIKIYSGEAEWKKGSSVLSGLGRSPLQLGIELSPLQGSISFVFPTEDFSKLSSWMIDPKGGDEGFSDPYLQKGFFRYLMVEAIDVIDKLDILKGLKPKLIEMPLVKEDAYSIDIAIEKNKETVWGRLICPPIFQESFKRHFAMDWNFSIPSDLYEQIDLPLSVVAGKTSVELEEWKKIQEGDFVLLDSCSYSPNTNKGTFQLTCENIPLFQVKLKDENIKILDYAIYYEEEKMSDENPYDFDDIEEEEMEEAVSVTQPSEEKMLSPKKIPISLTIEVTKLKMSLDKLLKLKPGNVLDLSVQVEHGVNIVANGKCVARGDLIQVGEVIGVKITEIGH